MLERARGSQTAAVVERESLSRLLLIVVPTVIERLPGLSQPREAVAQTVKMGFGVWPGV
jgi:hypothetical protein